jgi:hypothetical protein
MNEPLSDFISRSSRSGVLARVCLAPAKTYAETPGQCHKQGKATGADPNFHSQLVPALTKRQGLTGCAMLKSP